MQISITMDSLDATGKLTALRKKVVDLTPLHEIAVTVIEEATQDNFASQSWMGKKWKPWSATTSRRRAGGVILQQSGSLASITSVANATSGQVGSALEYAAIHQFGGRAGRGHKSRITARPWLPIKHDGSLASETGEQIVDEMIDHLESAL